MNLDAMSRRREEWSKLSQYVKSCIEKELPPRLLFVCTHNARRSQIGQTIAPILFRRALEDADKSQLADTLNVESYSGGSEVTRVHPNTLDALRQAGCKVQTEGLRNGSDDANSKPGREPQPDGAVVQAGNPIDNPMISVTYPGFPAQSLFSKTIDDAHNPKKGFAAIMVCSSADEACPNVFGADARISLPFTDPGKWDRESNAVDYYLQCMDQMAWDLFMAFRMAMD